MLPRPSDRNPECTCELWGACLPCRREMSLRLRRLGQFDPYGMAAEAVAA